MQQSSVTGRWIEKEDKRGGGRDEREGEREREGKGQCRELALNSIALCSATTGFY